MIITNLDQLKELIKDNLQSEEPSVALMQSIVSMLGTNKQISILLRALLEDIPKLHQVAARSYTHKNGFDKIVLLVSEQPQYKLRLHIWWPDYATENLEHIHDHSWNFSSAIITGAFRFQTYQMSEMGFDLYHYKCEFPKLIKKGDELRNSDLGYRMRYLGVSKLVNTFDSFMLAGNSYSLSKDVLHRITNIPEKLTSTILLHGAFLESSSNLFSTRSIDDVEHVSVDKFEVSKLIHKIEKYLAALEIQ